jgi:hypothetical protein
MLELLMNIKIEDLVTIWLDNKNSKNRKVRDNQW